MISERRYRAFLPVLLFLLLAWGCDSPLAVETPRNRYADNVSVLPGEDIGTPVSIDIPIDTTGGSWEPAHFSVALVLDGSGSISPQTNSYLKKAGNAFLDSLDGSVDEAAIVHVSATATMYQHLTTDVSLLRAAVDSLPIIGGTAMWDGIYISLLELQSVGTHQRKAVIVVTDSDDNSSAFANPSGIIDFAVRNDIAIYTVSLYLHSHELGLRNTAERTGGTHYPQPAATSLTHLFLGIAKTLRSP